VKRNLLSHSQAGKHVLRGVLLSVLHDGGSFLNYNQNFSSMLMAVGFILAMLTYSLGLARGK
jgi:hypothetical protein